MAIKPLLEPEAVATLLAGCGARVLLTLIPFPGADLYEKAVKAKASAPALRHLVLVDPAEHVSWLRRFGGKALG